MKRKNKHIIKQDYLNNDFLVSTIFIGMQNQIFETAIFKRKDGNTLGECEIYARVGTYDKAIEKHEEACHSMLE